MALYRIRCVVPGHKRDDYYEWNRENEMSKQLYSVPLGPGCFCSGLKTKDFMKYGKLKTYNALLEAHSKKSIYKTQHHFDYAMGMLNATIETIHNRLTGKCIHIFIETKKLLDFLKNTKIKTIDIAYDFIDKYNIKCDYKHILKDENNNDVADIKETKSCTVIIHHKDLSIPSYQYGITYIIYNNGKRELSALNVIDKLGPTIIHMYDKKHAAEPDAKLFYNFLFYAEAFPECFVD